MEHYALKIAYNGTAFCGWQVQKNGISVQKTLQAALEETFLSPISVTGCSRTDAGVHAAGFVCRADGIPDGIPADRIPEAVNAKLPPNISVTAASRVSDDFHPRYSAVGKEYCYRLRNSRIPDPFDQEYTTLWPTPKPVNADECAEICKQFIGTNDYHAFMASGSSVKDTVRTVTDFTCTRDGDIILFTVSADGFLYNMVRILVGTVLDIHSGKITLPPADILTSLSRKNAGRTMPAKGLCLTRVFYPDNTLTF